MGTSKAFVFSLDAFVAFSIAIIIIYSLIYFSSVPYSYYSAFMQVHYLARDTLTALSLSQTTDGMISRLDYVAISTRISTGEAASAAKEYIGPLIPNQFGYTLERTTPGGGWEMIYTTENSTAEGEYHRKSSYNKVKASVQMLTFDYETVGAKELPKSPYWYITCNGPYSPCDPNTKSNYDKDSAAMRLVRLTVFT
ncbi:MAG: hypothetical protein WCT31_04275 [Candidatus Micrarchaeia archaeon]|jgi:hypothetical protein